MWNCFWFIIILGRSWIVLIKNRDGDSVSYYKWMSFYISILVNVLSIGRWIKYRWSYLFFKWNNFGIKFIIIRWYINFV